MRWIHPTIAALLVAFAATLVPLGPTAAQDGTPRATPAALDPCGGPLLDMATPVAETEATVDPTTLDVDLLFIDLLIPHHEVAVEMAQVAQMRSTRPEIVSLAASIVATQSAEIEQLAAWRAEWYPDVPALTETQVYAGMETKGSPGRGGAPGLEDLTLAGMTDMLAELCEETDGVDVAFIDHMVEHHTAAILISQLVVETAVHPEMAAFAQTVIDVQSAEVATMLEWRDIWFADVPLDHHGGDAATPAP